jgi:hypothetical protein
LGFVFESLICYSPETYPVVFGYVVAVIVMLRALVDSALQPSDCVDVVHSDLVY